MSKILFPLLALVLIGASPAFAEGFSQVQFVGLLVVTLVIGAIMTLLLVLFACLMIGKLKKPKMIEVRAVQRRI